MKARRVEDNDGSFWHHEGKFRCPGCGAESDCHSPAPGKELPTPKTGDLNGCLYCGELSIIEVSRTGIVSLREITPQEREQVQRNQPEVAAQVKDMVASIRRARFYRGRGSADLN